MARERWGLYEPQTEHDACGIGFVAHIKGVKSRAIVVHGFEILKRLSHRAATGSDPHTGDGAGLSIQLPHRFFKRVGLELGFDMPRRRRYAVGQLFLPADPSRRAAIEEVVEEMITAEGQRILGWRDVPIEAEFAGPSARAVLPVFRQVYGRAPPTAAEYL